MTSIFELLSNAPVPRLDTSFMYRYLSSVHPLNA